MNLLQAVVSLSLILVSGSLAQPRVSVVVAKANAAKAQARIIHDHLLAKHPNATILVEKVLVLHQCVVAIQDAVARLDRSHAGIVELQEAASLLKFLTESKLNVARNATEKHQATLKASALNLAFRAEWIAKTARRLGV